MCVCVCLRMLHGNISPQCIKPMWWWPSHELQLIDACSWHWQIQEYLWCKQIFLLRRTLFLSVFRPQHEHSTKSSSRPSISWTQLAPKTHVAMQVHHKKGNLISINTHSGGHHHKKILFLSWIILSCYFFPCDVNAQDETTATDLTSHFNMFRAALSLTHTHTHTQKHKHSPHSRGQRMSLL